jgi:hypothetical protein
MHDNSDNNRTSSLARELRTQLQCWFKAACEITDPKKGKVQSVCIYLSQDINIGNPKIFPYCMEYVYATYPRRDLLPLVELSCAEPLEDQQSWTTFCLKYLIELPGEQAA